MQLEARLDHDAVHVGGPNLVHILLTLTAPDAPPSKPRAELNVAAVIDQSGSMRGEKLAYAKESVKSLIDLLGPRDRFSLVAFGSEVLPLVEAVAEADRTAAKIAVDQIECTGMTNLSGGWLKGIELVGRDARDESVNAVLLLTDGRANQGITDHDKLASLGQSVNRDNAIRTSCMGLGADFDEDLLRGIANAADGRFHYIESPDHAPEVFREELGDLLAVVAQNIEVELAFADGVTGVAQLTGHAWTCKGSTCRILLGDFGAGQAKHALLVAQLPAMSDLADVLLASMKLSYAEVADDGIQVKEGKKDLVIRVVDSSVTIEPGDPEVLLHIGIQGAAKAREEAVTNLDAGDLEGAMKVLEVRSNELRAMAPNASAPERLANEADQLALRARELKEQQDIVGTRKFMTAEGTAMSRSNYNQTRWARQRRSRPRPTNEPDPAEE